MLYEKRDIYILSFTAAGAALGDDIQSYLQETGTDSICWTLPAFCAPGRKELPKEKKEWIKRLWGKTDLIFIGAAGIAVRLIAPCVQDKFTDSAVIVADERGQFVIPLLSGHVGGGVDLARLVSEGLQAVCVVTTATDVNRRFAVDVFARQENLVIADRQAAKEISAAVLGEEMIGVHVDLRDCPVEMEEEQERTDHQSFLGRMRRSDPWGQLAFCSSARGLSSYRRRIWITDFPLHDQKAPSLCEGGTDLWLSPMIVVGIGCRRDVPCRLLDEQLRAFLKQKGISVRQVTALASIDLKAKERGLLELADIWRLPFYTYPAGELEKMRSQSQPSVFVSSVTGVDNVCERAARRCALSLWGSDRLVCEKEKMDKMTAAIVSFVP